MSPEITWHTYAELPPADAEEFEVVVDLNGVITRGRLRFLDLEWIVQSPRGRAVRLVDCTRWRFTA